MEQLALILTVLQGKNLIKLITLSLVLNSSLTETVQEIPPI